MEDCKQKYEEIIENIKEAKERMGGYTFSSWSEEDKTMLQRAIYYTNYYQTNYADTKEAEECMNWLKSLKDRYTWKPSNESSHFSI